jgi:hypothetical protein
VRHAVIAYCPKSGVNVDFGATFSGIDFVMEFAQRAVVFEEFTYVIFNKQKSFYKYHLRILMVSLVWLSIPRSSAIKRRVTW